MKFAAFADILSTVDFKVELSRVLCGYLFVSRTLCLFSVLHKERKQTVFVRQDGKSFCLKVIGRRQKINEWIHYINLLAGYFTSQTLGGARYRSANFTVLRSYQ